MIEVEITPDMIYEATKKAKEMGTLKKSITSGEGNIAGFLGELVVNTILDGVIDNTKDYDIMKNGVRYDVKTKRCTSEPKPDYECSVAAYNTVQKCDAYIFVRIEFINGEWGRAWVLGYYPKDEYFKGAKFLRRGQRDGDNWFKVKSNCYNMKISDLKELHENISP